jgi:hypothetical protein
MNKQATNILIECSNPESFDNTIQKLGAAALVGGGMPNGYVKKDGYFVMRVFGDAGFLKFAIQNQGYGRVIRDLEELV